MAARTETCPSCLRTFSTTANGDKHRKITHTYDLWRTPAGNVFRAAPAQRTELKRSGYANLSRGNQVRVCVDPATVGLVQNAEGVWKAPRGSNPHGEIEPGPDATD